MQSFELIGFPIPPSENQMYKTVFMLNKPRRVKSTPFKVFEKQVDLWGFQNKADINKIRAYLTQHPRATLALHIQLNWKYERMFTLKHSIKRIDALNRAGAIQDAIARTIGIDDSIFAYTSIEKIVSLHSEVANMTIEHHDLQGLESASMS